VPFLDLCRGAGCAAVRVARDHSRECDQRGGRVALSRRKFISKPPRECGMTDNGIYRTALRTTRPTALKRKDNAPREDIGGRREAGIGRNKVLLRPSLLGHKLGGDDRMALQEKAQHILDRRPRPWRN
jgi:hypothetical protein